MSQKKAPSWIIWVILVVAFLIIFLVNNSGGTLENKNFETLVTHIENGKVSEFRVIEGNLNEVTLRDGTRYQVIGTMDDELTKKLSKQGGLVTYGRESSWFSSNLLWILIPAAFVIFFIVFFLRKMGGVTNDIHSLRKSKARLLTEDSKVTFADVGGCEEAKEQLGDVIDFLRNPKRWIQAGARIPRGILLEGPPGCGKTLLSRAVAGETNAKFYFVSASEFVEMFVGVGAARVRDMFETAAKNAPAVIFIDEMDAVGRRRGSGIGTGHDEREQTLNQLLVCLDGFQHSEKVVVIGATNRPDIVDHALLRPGRFDRRIKIPELGPIQRLQILKIHTQNKALAPEISLEEIAERTQGMTGADLENLANEAALLAVRRTRYQDNGMPVLTKADFDRAMTSSEIRTGIFNKADTLMIESTTQVAEPTGKAVVRLHLKEGSPIEGEILWADASFIKLKKTSDGTNIMVSKLHIISMEALPGTEEASPEEAQLDPWSRQLPELA